MSDEARSAYESLRERVNRVGALHRSCAVTEGAGRLVWYVGLPLLALLLIQSRAALPYYLRAPVIPALVLALLWLAWRQVLRPLLEQYSLTRSAMLVESKKPELNSQLVSALDIYPDLQRERPRFEAVLVQAVVIQAQRATKDTDFCAVIDRRPSRRQLTFACITLALWVGAFVFDAAGLRRSLASLGTAWSEMNDVIAEAGGAGIVIDPLDRAAYLIGSDVAIHAGQKGFHNDEMTFHSKLEGETEWTSTPVNVDGAGRSEQLAKAVGKTFDCYFEAGRFKSNQVRVLVTERPRVVNLRVETEFPAYVRRAHMIEPRSDGNLKRKLFGSSVVLTIEANKKLKTAVMKRSYIEKPEELIGNGQYARAVMQLDNEQWLADESVKEIRASYTIKLTDEYGYSNDDADHAYELSVVKDEAPKVTLINIPNRSAADEPHLLEQSLSGRALTVHATDDCGVAKVTVHYRIEDLESNALKSEESKVRTFTTPPGEIKQLSLIRLSETGAKVGDRIVFWAEVEDAYDLEPKKGPHVARTQTFRIAVVTEEETFKDFASRETWTPGWYTEIKKVSLAGREQPGRSASDSEPNANVAAKLLNAPQIDDSVRADDQQLVQDYFGGLNVVK
jgi:hypothetical protein